MNCNHFCNDCFPIILDCVCVWTTYAIGIKIGANIKYNKKMTKNDKCQQTAILCYSPVPSCKEAVDRGSNVIFGHTFTNVCSKIETGFYFAFSSLTLQTFAILYFSYL